MAKLTLTWSGAEQAQAALAGLPDKIERRVLASALRKVAKQLLPAIQAATPVGKPSYRLKRLRKGTFGPAALTKNKVRGGRLRGSYKIRALKRSRRRVGVGIVTGTRAQLGITGRGYYPAHISFGYKTFRGKHKVAGENFMKRTAMAQRTALIGTLAQEIHAGVEREIRP